MKHFRRVCNSSNYNNDNIREWQRKNINVNNIMIINIHYGLCISVGREMN